MEGKDIIPLQMNTNRLNSLPVILGFQVLVTQLKDFKHKAELEMKVCSVLCVICTLQFVICVLKE